MSEFDFKRSRPSGAELHIGSRNRTILFCCGKTEIRRKSVIIGDAMNNIRYKAVVFDLDGTLLNTLEDLQDIVNHTMRKFGFPERTLDEVRAAVGNGVGKLLEYSLPDGRNTPDFDTILADMRAYYDVHPGTGTKPYPGVCEVIERFQHAGLKVAVVSNKIHSASVALCKKYFPTVDTVCGEREAEGIKRKPAPDSVFTAAHDMGVDVSDCIYVGDSEVDIATAHNAGIKCVSVLWGYREREYLETVGADVFARDADELYSVVCG